MGNFYSFLRLSLRVFGRSDDFLANFHLELFISREAFTAERRYKKERLKGKLHVHECS
jgi:hypothetical protein